MTTQNVESNNANEQADYGQFISNSESLLENQNFQDNLSGDLSSKDAEIDSIIGPDDPEGKPNQTASDNQSQNSEILFKKIKNIEPNEQEEQMIKDLNDLLIINTSKIGNTDQDLLGSDQDVKNLYNLIQDKIIQLSGIEMKFYGKELKITILNEDNFDPQQQKIIEDLNATINSNNFNLSGTSDISILTENLKYKILSRNEENHRLDLADRDCYFGDKNTYKTLEDVLELNKIDNPILSDTLITGNLIDEKDVNFYGIAYVVLEYNRLLEYCNNPANIDKLKKNTNFKEKEFKDLISKIEKKYGVKEYALTGFTDGNFMFGYKDNDIIRVADPAVSVTSSLNDGTSKLKDNPFKDPKKEGGFVQLERESALNQKTGDYESGQVNMWYYNYDKISNTLVKRPLILVPSIGQAQQIMLDNAENRKSHYDTAMNFLGDVINVTGQIADKATQIATSAYGFTNTMKFLSSYTNYDYEIYSLEQRMDSLGREISNLEREIKNLETKMKSSAIDQKQGLEQKKSEKETILAEKKQELEEIKMQIEAKKVQGEKQAAYIASSKEGRPYVPSPTNPNSNNNGSETPNQETGEKVDQNFLSNLSWQENIELNQNDNSEIDSFDFLNKIIIFNYYDSLSGDYVNIKCNDSDIAKQVKDTYKNKDYPVRNIYSY